MTNAADEYRLPDLPYAHDALQPVVSARIMELHHGKHHANYVRAANTLTEQLAGLAADADPSALLGALAFNVGGHVLHSLFWASMTPGASAPSPELAAAIDAAFGSRALLEQRLATAVAKLSGSGWAGLFWEPLGQRLLVSQLHDHQADLVPGAVPLLVIDGWEHAYYLDYTSDRAGWAKRFFEVADWSAASLRLAAAQA